MTVDLVTIFPAMIGEPLAAGVLGRAIDNGTLDVKVRDLRDFTTDRHRVVDEDVSEVGDGNVGPAGACVHDLCRDFVAEGPVAIAGEDPHALPAAVAHDQVEPAVGVEVRQVDLAGGEDAARPVGQDRPFAADLDGQPIRSCVTPVSAVCGAKVVTLAGLGTPDKPHPLQTAYVEEQVPQCGYCINGWLMTAAAFLRDKKKPTEAEIKDALSGLKCRCGTHISILKAVKRAAEMIG